MLFDDNIGFAKEKRKNVCKTFESNTPPKFDGDFVTLNDEKIGEIRVEKKKVVAFRQSGNKYKIRVCKK